MWSGLWLEFTPFTFLSLSLSCKRYEGATAFAGESHTEEAQMASLLFVDELTVISEVHSNG